MIVASMSNLKSPLCVLVIVSWPRGIVLYLRTSTCILVSKLLEIESLIDSCL